MAVDRLQYCVALPIMYFCIWYGMPVESGLSRRIRDLDWPGIFYAGAGSAFSTPLSTKAIASIG